MDASVLNSEKILLAREILSISDIRVLYEVKHRLAGIFDKKKETEKGKTARVLRAVSGKWRDSRDADTMVDDIYNSRTSRNDDDLIKILNS